MYQNLSKVLSVKSNEDSRSVHFMMFPEVKESYFDADIERCVARMQSVIEAGRVVRERFNLPLKVKLMSEEAGYFLTPLVFKSSSRSLYACPNCNQTPLRELVILHNDPQYLADVSSLESFIVEELNVKTVTLTSDENKYGVKYTIQPDFKMLGSKLKKDLGTVKKALTQLSEADTKQFMKTKKLVVAGFELDETDLRVLRSVEKMPGSSLENNSDNDVIIFLDTQMDINLVEEGLAREIVNRVQRLRKKVKKKTRKGVIDVFC